MSMNIVLLEPEMPANTGNIGRTCVATGTKLHLIKPLGFEITDKMVKRAGLDYWPHLNYEVYENFEDFLEKNPDCAGKLYMATTKARHIYTEVAYEPDGYLMFGKESAGIPEEILVKYEDYCMRIPMEYNIRSLNLSNSVAMCCMRPSDSISLRRWNCRGICTDCIGTKSNENIKGFSI